MLAVCAVLGLVSGPAQAGGNFPPVAEASASPAEVLLGETVNFSSAGSFDPDGGPSPLSFGWDFGDGQLSTEPNPSHVYANLGVHIATLTVSDGGTQSLVTLAVVTLPTPTPTRPHHSGPITLTADDALLAVANPDSDSISIISTNTLSVTEVPVCDDPRNVIWSADDTRLYVTCFGSDELWSLSASGDLMGSTPTGRQPFGVSIGGGERVVVANYGGASIEIFDSELGPPNVIDVDDGPRAVAISADGQVASVTHFLTTGNAARVTRVDLTAETVSAVVQLAEDPGPDTSSSGRGVPNVLATIAVDPAGLTTWVGAIKANTGRGPFVDGLDLHPRNRLRGVFAPIDSQTATEAIDLRIDTNDADGVSAIAFSPRGRFAYLTHQGAARLSVYDIPMAELVDTSDGSAVNVESRVDTGSAPRGIAIASDGSVAYVANSLSRDVTVFDLTDLRNPVSTNTVAVTDEPLDATIALGKRIFFSSREPVHSDQNYIACASCHPDSGQDGRTWDFTQFGEGLRNTIDLRGRSGMGHGPVHWTGNFDEIQDFENDIVGGFGGEGLLGGEAPHAPLDDSPNAGRSVELDALAAYVSSLDRFPGSPYRDTDGGLGQAALRGFDLFFDDETQCADCHVPPTFSDSRLTENPSAFTRHLVGTRGDGSGMGLGQVLVGFDTPTVIGLWNSAPYLHDGSADTLLEVLTSRNIEDRHGKTSHLSDDELDDLVVYMLSLQGDEDEYPPLPPGDTDTDSNSGADTSTGGESASSSGAATTTSGTTQSPPDSSSSNGPDSGIGTDTDTDTDTGGEGDDAALPGGCGCATPSGPNPIYILTLLIIPALLRPRKR